jgi:hypothetical protein
MAKTRYNPQKLSAQILAKMPKGARLLRDDAERLAFSGIAGPKPDLHMYCAPRWIGLNYGGDDASTYCTTRPLGWDKPAATEKASVPVVEGTAVTVATACEWFIPVIDHAGVGDNWQSDNPLGTLEAAKQAILKAHRPGALALIVRVMLPCHQ